MKNQTHCKNGHEFTLDNTLWQRNGTHRICRICKRAGENRRAPRYKDRRYRVRSLYNKGNPEKIKVNWKRHHVKTAYGLTMEQFKEKLDSQNNLCALCGKPFEGTGKTQFAPVLDHDHSDGTLREFIHSRCNKGIGQFGDDIELIELAMAYLKKHQEIKNVPEQN